MKLQLNYWLQTFLAVARKRKSEMTSYLNNGYDVKNYFAKFEKFIPHSMNIPSFMTIGSQMPELDWEGGFFAPPPQYKIGSQNTPYKLGLNYSVSIEESASRWYANVCWMMMLVTDHYGDHDWW